MTCVWPGFEETFLDRNGDNGVFDLNNDTSPSASAGSSLPDGRYNGVTLSDWQDEAGGRGLLSRELVDVRDSLSPW